MSEDPRAEVAQMMVLGALQDNRALYVGAMESEQLEAFAADIAFGVLAVADAVDPYRLPGNALVMSDSRVKALTEALRELVDSIDPQEGCEHDDLSLCPYFRRGLPNADPAGTCGFGCHDEPQCQTCRPRDGWPLEVARRLLGDAEWSAS